MKTKLSVLALTLSLGFVTGASAQTGYLGGNYTFNYSFANGSGGSSGSSSFGSGGSGPFGNYGGTPSALPMAPVYTPPAPIYVPPAPILVPPVLVLPPPRPALLAPLPPPVAAPVSPVATSLVTDHGKAALTMSVQGKDFSATGTVTGYVSPNPDLKSISGTVKVGEQTKVSVGAGGSVDSAPQVHSYRLGVESPVGPAVVKVEAGRTEVTEGSSRESYSAVVQAPAGPGTIKVKVDHTDAPQGSSTGGSVGFSMPLK